MIRKHSVVLSGHATSFCLEDEFWQALKDIAQQKGLAVRQLLMQIDNTHTGNLSSAIRVYVLKELKK
ncbi:MAG: ribbon-helix-helix domain-containing protein [Alphaproteobacteria bacterium]|nr:ribbon-helix-helix domain-containing protein [Alphaproteobacteria bacterium]